MQNRPTTLNAASRHWTECGATSDPRRRPHCRDDDDDDVGGGGETPVVLLLRRCRLHRYFPPSCVSPVAAATPLRDSAPL